MKASFNELRAFCAKNHINTKGMRREQIEAAMAAVNLVFEVPAKRGRPVNPQSARQARLARKGQVKRGRPINATSARQERLARKGTVKRGRPVNPQSARQLALAAVASATASTVVSENQNA